MSTFSYRWRLKLAPSSFIHLEEECLEVQLSNWRSGVFLRAVGTDSLSATQTIDMISRGFSSAQEATDCAYADIDCARIGFFMSHLRFAMSDSVQVFDRVPATGDTIIANRFDGLIVFPDGCRVRGAEANFGMKASPSIPQLRQNLEYAVAVTECLTEKLSAAIDLVMSSAFEFSPRARYLTLTAAIECLREQERHPPNVQDAINAAINAAADACGNSDSHKDTRNYLTGRLNNLRSESVSQACHRLITDRLGNDDAKLFKALYGMRSRLIHGSVSSIDGFEESLSRLQDLCVRLLLSYFH